MSGKFTYLPKFISQADTSWLLELCLARKLWLFNNPNGDVGAWLPEKDTADFVLEHAIIHSRLEMAREPKDIDHAIFLKYPEGDGIRPHKDPNHNGRHIRCGILLQEALSGGLLHVDGEWVDMEPGDAVIYRPDKYEHWVTPITEGERYLLTVGTVY